MARERDRLLADALHQAAVAADDISVVIDDIAAEAFGEQALREREAHRVAEPLAERAGRGLDAAGVTVFGVAGGAAAELAKMLQFVERHVGVTGEMQQGIEQHRAVAGRQDEAVAIGPVRLRCIELQELGEQDSGDVGHAHRQAGMTGIRLLHGVHGQGPDGVRHVAAVGGLFVHLCKRRVIFRGGGNMPTALWRVNANI